MIRMVVSSNSAAAKSYFTKSLDRGDYYREGQEMAGIWYGSGAKLLGLSGEVKQRDFFALCENRIPGKLDNLTERTKANRRVGYDINFHVPKSVSLLYAIGEDSRILEAFRASVSETLLGLEARMRTRVRLDGSKDDRETGNMVGALFVHSTARPIGGLPDPHLHAHAFTFNATFDEVEKRWKAGEFVALKKEAPLFEAAFHASLAERMRVLGYEPHVKGKFWEVSGVPDWLIERFSRRTSEINKLAKEIGIENYADLKAELGARTRMRKGKDASLDSLRDEWRNMAGKDGLAVLAAARGRPGRFSDADKANAAERAVTWAVQHSLERVSAVKEKKLVEMALRYAVGQSDLASVSAAVQKANLLRKEFRGDFWITTREVLAEEARMVEMANRGRGQCLRINPHYQPSKKTSLNKGQISAVRFVLDCPDRVMAIRGGAGTGKTTLMKEAVREIEARGHKVFVFAPTAEASRGVLRKEGFKDAETIAKLFADESLQEKVRSGVLWVDEAGLLGVKATGQLLAFAEKNNCRLILGGDYRQHSSMERGDALRVLVERAGLAAAQVREIVRQRGQYKTAVEHLSKGNVADAFRIFDGLGFIKEVKAAESYGLVANEFLAATRAGKSVLVVSPTHVERQDASQAVRSKLREARLIGSKERELLKLTTCGWTEAQKQDTASYQSGDVIQFHKSARGFRAGDRTEVVNSDPLGNVWVKGKLGPCILNRQQANRFDVFRPSTIQFAKGDMIRFTRNGYAVNGQRAINNGTTYKIAGFVPLSGDIVLNNGWIVRRSYGHFDHGYAITSQASQGKTVDIVIGVQTQRSVGASSMEQFYVTMSRGREACRLYTDNKNELLKLVGRSNERTSATEIFHRFERSRRADPVRRKDKGPERER
jgi:conjugative relaxase-like TrwC/TraI family protein